MPSTGPAEFFGKTADLKLFEYLLMREDKAVLVCDRPFYDYLSKRLQEENKRLKAGLVCWTDIKQSPETVLQGYKNLFVCSLHSEVDILQQLRKLLPGNAAFGLVGDISCCLAANSNPWKEGNGTANLTKEIRALDKLVLILSTARSGSTYFCDLMCSSGICGLAKEDLRPYVVYLARHGMTINFDLKKWLAVLIRNNKQDGIFASKIIAHFLFELLDYLEPELKIDLIEELKQVDTKVIYLYRSDKIKQAVSSYFANQVQVWHVASNRGQLDLQTRARHVAYDFQKLKHSFEFIQQHERRLVSLLEEAHPNYTQVVYEELTAAPQQQLLKIAKMLERTRVFDKKQAISGLQRTSNNKTAQVEALFRADLQARELSDKQGHS